MSLPLALALDLVPPPASPVAELTRRWCHERRRGSPRPSARDALMEEILAFAAQAEQQIALQQQRIEQLEAQSLTDEMTGLPNRRAFDQSLRRTLATARRHGETGLVAYVDLDRFKEINDTYGHDAGDAALRHIARLLVASVRMTDLVARLHGDEFAILLVHADPQEGRRRFTAIATRIATTPLIHDGFAIPLSASLGVVAYGPDSEASELLRRADHAMYAHKRDRHRPWQQAAAE